MWLGLWAGIFVIILLAAGIAMGGIFTLILLPLAGVSVIGAMIALLWARATRSAVGDTTEPRREAASEQPLPHSPPSAPGHVPTTPDGLLDARRKA
jgi:hypothetical protein